MLLIEQLKFTYPATPKLKGASTKALQMCFDLTINAGEILSIVGPSGSGKSTLLNLIAGFNQAESGKILIHNKDITHFSIPQRPVTTVFQEHNLFPHLDVFTNIAIGLQASLKLSKEEILQIDQALEQVGLIDYKTRKPAQLSGGQRQRVAIARALVRKHEVLLLDEPLAALGPAMREEIIELLKNIVISEKIMALLVSHQPSDAILASERCAFINEGKVLIVGDAKQILQQPEQAEIKNYLGLL
jgi:thiamine transport system ATP-binding protein